MFTKKKLKQDLLNKQPNLQILEKLTFEILSRIPNPDRNYRKSNDIVTSASEQVDALKFIMSSHSSESYYSV